MCFATIGEKYDQQQGSGRNLNLTQTSSLITHSCPNSPWTSAQTSFNKEKLETSAQDPRKLHNIFSSLLNPPAPPSPSSLTAKDFATFYTEKIERICQTFTSLPTSPTSHSQHSATPSLTQLSTVASEEVLQITRSCNPTTCPLDPIPSAMLQTISPDLLEKGSLQKELYTTASAGISACLAGISSWMTAHQLKLNPSKTELLIIPAYRPLIRCSKPVLKLVKTWPEGAISALQDCFECTDWDMFREAATNTNTTDLEEYTSSMISYISKCIDDVTISKSITTSNQKLWMTAKVHALLKSRDSAFRVGDKDALRTTWAKLS
ncbi:hypothetical protein QTP86_032711 [Hemibagrus guttatus]|nr:hypothetical protein QTP86_032711 [Hemibagrus guttatus]